jgi:hypothetical protein
MGAGPPQEQQRAQGTNRRRQKDLIFCLSRSGYYGKPGGLPSTPSSTAEYVPKFAVTTASAQVSQVTGRVLKPLGR